jgi:hypothetical protein
MITSILERTDWMHSKVLNILQKVVIFLREDMYWIFLSILIMNWEWRFQGWDLVIDGGSEGGADLDHEECEAPKGNNLNPEKTKEWPKWFL